MSKTINLNQSLYEICTQFPEVISIMESLGFENISKPTMLQTVGRVMTIPKGCRVKDIPLETVIHTFENHEFELIK
ncbi:DUF1858 domain-containing protein [Robertmurraya korlensis]|uniref:DUF1858 domain-containing protein n=1 Tax=Robertmurraya korlensis TaxID=519977 RepID=UPI00082624A7|nr:DUF1858 domain-containing protein [Robertmurraya korlensis]